jgi:hypothetical protein
MEIYRRPAHPAGDALMSVACVSATHADRLGLMVQAIAIRPRPAQAALANIAAAE